MTALSKADIILQVIAQVPAGRVATYGQLAALAGYPRHARFVGTVLRNLPAGSTIPWHRVVNGQGRLSTSGAQRALLEAEGIEFIGERISLKAFGWQP